MPNCAPDPDALRQVSEMGRQVRAGLVRYRDDLERIAHLDPDRWTRAERLLARLAVCEIAAQLRGR